jgi:tetratricopeptide (TPR) repeat protein
MVLETQLVKEQKWDEAKKICDQARALDPNSGYIATELAALYLEHGGDVNVAVSLAQRAKQLMPNSPDAADTLGWAYYKLGSAQTAIPSLQEALQKSPGNPMYEYHLGMAYASAGRSKLAEPLLRQALRAGADGLYATNAKAALAKIAESRQ